METTASPSAAGTWRTEQRRQDALTGCGSLASREKLVTAPTRKTKAAAGWWEVPASPSFMTRASGRRRTDMTFVSQTKAAMKTRVQTQTTETAQVEKCDSQRHEE